jgi:hypothetical protein
MKPTEEQILAVLPRAIEILTELDEPVTNRSIRAQVRLLIRNHYGWPPLSENESAWRWYKDWCAGLNRAERFFKRRGDPTVDQIEATIRKMTPQKREESYAQLCEETRQLLAFSEEKST